MRALLARRRRQRAADRRKRDRVLAWLVAHQARQCLADCPFYHRLPD